MANGENTMKQKKRLVLTHRINHKNLTIMLDWFKSHNFDYKHYCVNRTICKLWSLYNRPADWPTRITLDMLTRYAQTDVNDNYMYNEIVHYILTAGTNTYKVEFQNTNDTPIYIEADDNELDALIANLKKLRGRDIAEYKLQHMRQVNLSETDIHNILDSIDWAEQDAGWLCDPHNKAIAQELYIVAEDYRDDCYIKMDEETVLPVAYWKCGQVTEMAIVNYHICAYIICNGYNE